MDVDPDREAPDIALPSSPAPFAAPSGEPEPTEGVDAHAVESSPIPPPHRTPPRPQPPGPPPVDAEACKAAGNKFFKMGDFAKAIEEYSRAIEVEPDNPTYRSNRSAALMSAGRYNEALEDAKLADVLEPDNPKVLHRLARIYTSLGRPDEALGTYARIQPAVASKDKAPATSMQLHVKQAQDALRDGTAGSMALHALDQAERHLGVGAARPRKWQLMRGDAYLKMGNANAIGDAQSVAMSLLRNNNRDPEALVLRGRALYAAGDNEKALQHFRQALSYDPEFKDAVNQLRMVQKLDRMKAEGNAAFKAGRYQEAADVYGAALEVDPLNKGTNAKILQNRAMASIKACSAGAPPPPVHVGLTSPSSKRSGPPSRTAAARWAWTPPTSRPARPRPARSANPAAGRTRCASTRPSPRPTRTSRASPRTCATRSWS